jgi:cysteine synthase
MKNGNNWGTPRDLWNPTRNPLPPAYPLPRHLNPFDADRVDLIAVPLFGNGPNMKTFMSRWMLERAEAAGQLKGVHTLVEATSGNTGADLGILAPWYGISRIIAVIERDTAPGKLEQLRLCGVEPAYPMDGQTTIETARELGKQPGWLNLDQYSSAANVEAHEKWTGPHIWQQTSGKVSVVVLPMGTTGTACGVSKFLRQQDAYATLVTVVGVALAPGEAVPGVRTEEKLQQVAFDWRSAIDDLVLVFRHPSYAASMDLIRTGRFYGPSSGAAFSGAKLFVEKQKENGKLNRFRNEDDRVVVAFTCGDGPFLYQDKYSTLLDDAAFRPRNPSLL